MKSKKAFIKQNGEIGERENPAIEYNDKNYIQNQQKQIEKINEILSNVNAKESKIENTNKNETFNS
jgi:hypothetical protein